tara:strand:+ start:671 stop:2221 length:1551 start_codon:yes stop_codon:yes gene_type:complete
MFKKKTYLIFFSIIAAFCFMSSIYYIQNSNPGSIIGERILSDYSKPIKWFQFNNAIDIKSYGFNKPSPENALVVDFSENDLKYNDSIISLTIKNGEYFDDGLKEWRKTNIIYKKKIYKVKYKFHGSHNFNYKKGKISLKIKSKENINGVKKFTLISGFQEASFINVFLTVQANKLGLISPDPGEIILANLNGDVEDHWFTEDLSLDYLNYNYQLNDFHMFEVSDNWERNGGPHYSELDDFYYYLDEENLSSDNLKFIKYKNFILSMNYHKKEDVFNNIDYKYIGKFLANLYFFYGSHHIQGDNNKLLYDYETDIVYPVARNEGVYEKISNILDFDEGVFFGRKSPTFNLYRKFVCNDSIKLYRDQELFKLISNKKKIVFELDSIHVLYKGFHKYYNKGFMNLRFDYKRLKEIIEHNTNSIDKYLNNGEVIIAYDEINKTMKIATDYRVPLKLINITNSKSYLINGVKFDVLNDKIKTHLVEREITLKNIITKDQLRIVNQVTLDTIPKSKIIFNHF